MRSRSLWFLGSAGFGSSRERAPVREFPKIHITKGVIFQSEGKTLSGPTAFQGREPEFTPDDVETPEIIAGQVIKREALQDVLDLFGVPRGFGGPVAFTTRAF